MFWLQLLSVQLNRDSTWMFSAHGGMEKTSLLSHADEFRAVIVVRESGIEEHLRIDGCNGRIAAAVPRVSPELKGALLNDAIRVEGLFFDMREAAELRHVAKADPGAEIREGRRGARLASLRLGLVANEAETATDGLVELNDALHQHSPEPARVAANMESPLLLCLQAAAGAAFDSGSFLGLFYPFDSVGKKALRARQDVLEVSSWISLVGIRRGFEVADGDRSTIQPQGERVLHHAPHKALGRRASLRHPR